MSAKKLSELNESSVEEWCEKYIENGEWRALNKLESEQLASIILYEDKFDEDDEINDFIKNHFPLSVMNRRIEVVHTYTVSPSVMLMMGNFVSNPAIAVMMANYLQYKVSQLDTDFINVLCFIEIFRKGYPIENSLQIAWDNQKVIPDSQMGSDNMLDYRLFSNSINKRGLSNEGDNKK